MGIQPWFKTLRNLGPGQICQIDECNNQAYSVCNDVVYPSLICCCLGAVATGCNKRLCEHHVEMWYTNRGWPIVSACKDGTGERTECAKKVHAQYQKSSVMCLLIWIVIALLFFVVIPIIAIAVAKTQNLATWDAADHLPKDVYLNMTFDHDKKALKFQLFLPEDSETFELYFSGYLSQNETGTDKFSISGTEVSFSYKTDKGWTKQDSPSLNPSHFFENQKNVKGTWYVFWRKILKYQTTKTSIIKQNRINCLDSMNYPVLDPHYTCKGVPPP